MAGTMHSGGGRRTPIVGINVTPMVDVVLVLLDIMMVSAVYIVSQTLKVELPKSASSDEAEQTPLSLTITKEGTFLFRQKPVDDQFLLGEFRNAKSGNKDVSLVVTADRESYHGDVVHAIDLAKTVGITKFAINVERSH